MDPHFLGKVAIKAVFARGDNALITRSPGDPKWEIPGGRLHEGEGVEEAILREIREELGIAVTLGPAFYFEQYLQGRDGSLHLLITYRVDCPEDIVFQPDAREVEELRWITKEELGTSFVVYNNVTPPFLHRMSFSVEEMTSS
jgi:8-oxo-dGTP diphosphatase